jgi:hypothetical protein
LTTKYPACSTSKSKLKCRSHDAELGFNPRLAPAARQVRINRRQPAFDKSFSPWSDLSAPDPKLLPDRLVVPPRYFAIRQRAATCLFH